MPHSYCLILYIYIIPSVLRSNPLTAPAPMGHLQAAGTPSAGQCEPLNKGGGKGGGGKGGVRPKAKPAPKAKTAVQEATKVFRLPLDQLSDNTLFSKFLFPKKACAFSPGNESFWGDDP